MKFPFSWLKEIIPLEHSPHQVAEILTNLGVEVESLLTLPDNDVIFEVSLTPNLIHDSNILGIAREIASFTGQEIRREEPFPQIQKGRADLKIEVDQKHLCPLYKARVVYDVKVKPSPEWLIKRLEACNIRSVNNVVDVTNLVMLELGHPLHAFDHDQIEGKKLLIRKSQPQESIDALDGKRYHLNQDILVIADQKKPLAIAGIMGGVHSEVSEKTKTVVLESAYFKPEIIRRASKSLKLLTEASYRFERGADPQALERALNLASHLLQKIEACGYVSEIIEESADIFPPKVITCRLSRINRVLGTKLVLGEVESIFRRLFFKIVKISGETFEIEVPTYRQDISQEIDLIEEVFRSQGNNNIFKKEQKVFYQSSSLTHNPLYLFAKRVKFHLFSQGLQELLTCNLISPEEASWVSPDIFPKRSLIKIINPTSLAHAVMRPLLLSNLIQVVRENAHHNIFNVSGFEMGKIHFRFKDEVKEPISLGLILTGDRFPYHWQSKSREADFFDLKGILENLFEGLKIKGLHFHPSHWTHFHPGRQAQISFENKEIGFMGALHPEFLEKIGLHNRVFYAEINVDELFSLSEKDARMQPLPLFPGSIRDWTCTVPGKKLTGDILDLINAERSKILENVMVLDVYQNKNLGFERKNITFRFFYRDLEKTLSFEEVEKEHERIINSISHKVNV